MRTSALSRAGRLWVTTFGLGNLRPAPGTWGSMPPLFLYAALAALGSPGWLIAIVLMLVGVVFALACILLGDAAEAYYNTKDPSSICADETAGVCLAALPLTLVSWPGLYLAVGLIGAFLAFRLTDIIKAWPAGGLQKLPSGWGVVLDDLVAGVQAAILVGTFILIVEFRAPPIA